MRLAFDANVLIEVDLRNPLLYEKLAELRLAAPSNPSIPSPVVSEYYYGFINVNKKEEALKILSKYDILNTSKNSSLILAELKYDLGRNGQTVSDIISSN